MKVTTQNYYFEKLKNNEQRLQIFSIRINSIAGCNHSPDGDIIIILLTELIILAHKQKQ
jgi:hypothetical protein